MPGKLKLGLDGISAGAVAFEPRVALAYCQGRAARQAGAPDANPFNKDEEEECNVAWQEGYDNGLILDANARGGCQT